MNHRITSRFYCFCRLLITMAAALPCSVLLSQSNHPPQASFDALINRVWQFELTEDPLLATNAGDPRGQDRLPDLGLAVLEGRFQTRRSFRKELDSIQPARLSENSQIDYELLKHRLEQQIADHEFQLHLVPISNRDGFHINLPELPRMMKLRSETDFRNYLARLKDISRYTDDHIALMRSGIGQGLT